MNKQTNFCVLTGTEITKNIFIDVNTVIGTECCNLCVVCSAVQIKLSALSIPSCLSSGNIIGFIFIGREVHRD
jgi:hypothetical protein